MTLAWGLLDECYRVELDPDVVWQVDRDTCTGRWAAPKVRSIDSIDACEEVHGREEDVDVGAIGQG